MTIPRRAACLERAVALWLLLPPPPPRDDDDSDEANDEVRRGGGDGSAAGRAIAEGPGESVDMLGSRYSLCAYGIGSGDSSVIDTRATPAGLHVGEVGLEGRRRAGLEERLSKWVA